MAAAGAAAPAFAIGGSAGRGLRGGFGKGLGRGVGRWGWRRKEVILEENAAEFGVDEGNADKEGRECEACGEDCES